MSDKGGSGDAPVVPVAPVATAAPVALVTGAAKRVGRTVALALAEDGHDVAVHYGGSAAEAAEVADEIRGLGRRAALVQGDLAEPGAPGRIMRAVVEQLGAPVVLVNNASLFERDELDDMSEQQWEAHMAVNLRAPVFLAQAFAKAKPAGAAGNIINIIDQRVLKLNPLFFSYTISKAGLFTATCTLAQALAGQNIRVNAIGPGPTLPSKRMSQEDFAKQCSLTLLGCGTSPEEIAHAVRFILSAPAFTGQMIVLDGGQHLRWETPDITEVPE